MIKRLIFLFLAASMLLAACQPAASPLYESQRGLMPELAPAYADSAPGGGGFDAAKTASEGFVSEESAGPERVVIKTGNRSIAVADPVKTMAEVSKLAEQEGGFVVSSNLYYTTIASGAEVPQGSISIRVPAEKFEDILAQIEAGAGRVLSRNDSGQDVTREYTDLQSRLRNLQDAEAQLRLIMEDARRTEDVLAVFNQLTAIREQIEVIQGQIEYYATSAKFSLINVDIVADAAIQPITIGGWEPVGVAKEAVQALLDTLTGLADILIWLVLYLLPVALVIGVPVFFIVRGVRRWLRKRKPAA